MFKMKEFHANCFLLLLKEADLSGISGGRQRMKISGSDVRH